MVARLEHPAARAPAPLTLGGSLAPQAAVSVSPDSSPLTTDHFRIIADSRARARKVFRAASVATLSGWTTGFFGIITILTSLTQPVALALGVGMCVIAWNEFRGAAMLRRFDLRAPRRLALGQLLLGAMIVGYAIWGLFTALLARSASGSSDPQVDAMLAEIDMDGLVRSLTAAVYAGVALVGIIVPGLTALYYLTRAGRVRAFLAATPPWAVQTLAS